MTTYTCNGPTRGSCGIQHATPEECVAHILADHSANNGTDRIAIDSEGTIFELWSDFGKIDPPQLRKPQNVKALLDTIDAFKQQFGMG